MVTKSQLKETIDQLPDQFSLDELMDKIILVDKINRGNLQSEKSETLSEEEVDKEMAKWFK